MSKLASARTMTNLLHFAPLDFTDAKDIHRLQQKLFSADLTESLEEIREILVRTDEFMVCNLSFGLFDGSSMVGYMFAYIESESLYHEHDEDIVYIKEIALSPGYEAMLLRIFAKLFQQWSAYTPGLALEAHVLEDSLRNWQRMVRVFKYYGLSSSVRAAPDEESGLPYSMLRLDIDARISQLPVQALPLPKSAWSYDETVSVLVVTEPRQWLALKHVWDTLLGETTDSNVFQTFDYLWLWWKYFGTWNDLRIIVVMRGDTILGVVPLMIEYFQLYGRTVRKFMFISAPMEMSRPKLIFGRNNSACLPAFLSYLKNIKNDWDIFDIDEQIHSEQTDNLIAGFRASSCLVAESETLCPIVEMDTDWETFTANLSKNMRSNINRIRRRLAGLGEVRVLFENRWPALRGALDEYCELENRSWKADESLNIESSRRHYFFYFDLARKFGQYGNFELRLLQCNGKPIASTFGIRLDGVFQSLKIAHDRSFDRYSPGTALESYELENLFDSGVKTYEFMGSFLANKLRWTSNVCRTTNIHIYRRKPRLIVFFYVYFVLKRLLKRYLKILGQFENVDRFRKRFFKTKH